MYDKWLKKYSWGEHNSIYTHLHVVYMYNNTEKEYHQFEWIVFALYIWLIFRRNARALN